MRKLIGALACAAPLAIGLFGASRALMAEPRQAPKVELKSEIKSDVATLLKRSTDVYKKMKSYRHTAKYTFSLKGSEREVHEDLNFTLALERPNRFVYKLDSNSRIFQPVAAYCDGTTFINFKAKVQPAPLNTRPLVISQYTKTKAPGAYTGINIVDDVEFQPIATYIIALMLQGDVLADKDVRAAMEKASIKPAVTENGKKWQVLEMLFGAEETPITLYIGQDDHLIGKATQKGELKSTEIVDAVKIDKPIEPAVFQYTLPADAKEVERFTAPQRPDDARRATGGKRVARR
jgi:hypothetical protein